MSTKHVRRVTVTRMGSTVTRGTAQFKRTV